MITRISTIVLLLFLSSVAFSNTVAINNFLVKEHLLKNSKLAIIAADSADHPLESVNGVFMFTINGFKQELKFNDGIATAPQEIEKSAFVYIKHKNELGTHSKLFYVIKRNDSLNPVKISWIMLLVLPMLLIAVAAMFRKFLIFAVILLVGLFFFNSSKGLRIPTFFETIVDGLKSLF